MSLDLAAAPDKKPSSARDWLVVLILLAAATLAGYLLDPYVSVTSQAMLYVLAVVVASYTLPWVPSLACAFAAVSAFNFFFVPPRWTFEVENREQLIALFTMLALALVISHLGTALRRETQVARLNERRARQLQELAAELAACARPEEVLSLGRQSLNKAFPGPVLLAGLTETGALALPPELISTFQDVPWVPPAERVAVEPLGPGFWKVQVNYGFKDTPDIPKALAACKSDALPINLFETTYFLSRETLVPTRRAGMAHWREGLFAFMSRNAGNIADFLQLPNNCVIELGTRVQI